MRPIPTVSISNYIPIEIDNRFLSIISNLNYEIFIGKLERDRENSKCVNIWK